MFRAVILFPAARLCSGPFFRPGAKLSVTFPFRRSGRLGNTSPAADFGGHDHSLPAKISGFWPLFSQMPSSGKTPRRNLLAAWQKIVSGRAGPIRGWPSEAPGMTSAIPWATAESGADDAKRLQSAPPTPVCYVSRIRQELRSGGGGQPTNGIMMKRPRKTTSFWMYSASVRPGAA